jgi:hypothetical protein
MIKEDWLIPALFPLLPNLGTTGWCSRAYCRFITRATAEHLALESVSYGDFLANDAAETYCDDHGIYGVGRAQVREKIQAEIDILKSYFEPESCGPPGE